MFKAVIFDLNGVFIKSPKLSDRFRDDFGVVQEKFLPALREIMAKVRRPKAGDAYSYWKPYLDEWGVNLSEDEFYDYWFGAEKEAPEMTALARRLKGEGVKVIILSNNFVERAAYYDKNFPFLKEIADKIYYSWQTGFVKSDIRAWEKVLSDNGLRGEDCLYFDDSEENIEAAEKTGMRAYVFDGAEGVKKILELF